MPNSPSLDVGRRGFLGAGLAAAGGAVLAATGAASETAHTGHDVPAATNAYAGSMAHASHGGMITFLSRYSLPKNISAVLRWYLSLLRDLPFVASRSTDTIRQLFQVGARWESATPEDITTIRWMLLRTRDDTFVEVMKLLARDGHCAPEILHALGRTPTMRARMTKVGFVPPPGSAPHRFDRHASTLVQRGRH